MFDVNRIRKDFPILEETIYGKPLVYLDNGATAQRPLQVVEKMTEYYLRYNSNVHRGVHYLSNKCTDANEQARETVREFIHAESTDEVIFTRGTTESINLVAYTFGEAFIREGDEIIVTEMEHHANIVPWQMLCERKKAVLKVVPFNDFQPLEEALPAGFVLLHALLCAQNLTVSVFCNANCHQNRDVFVFTAPVPLQVDAIHIDVRIPARQRPLSPVLDIHICLLVQFADRGRRYPAAPQRLCDVLYTPHRYARQVHLDKRFLHAAFPAPVPLNDCRFEADSLQPRHMKRYLPGGRGQPTVIVPAAIPLTGFAALIPPRLCQLVRLRFQQVIQRFFHAPAYKFPDFPLDYFLVQCYNFLGHGLRLLSNVCLATSFYQMTLTLSLVLGTVFNPPVLEFAQLIVPYPNFSP